jgi:hypothetical protein
MLTSAHGAPGALSIGLSVGEFLILLITIGMLVMIATIGINCSSHVHIYVVTNLILFF